LRTLHGHYRQGSAAHILVPAIHVFLADWSKDVDEVKRTKPLKYINNIFKRLRGTNRIRQQIARTSLSCETMANGDSSNAGANMYYGHIRHPETGECLATVKDGKITAPNGVSYSLVGDMIVAPDGTELGYLSPFVGLTQGTGDLANQLFRRR